MILKIGFFVFFSLACAALADVPKGQQDPVQAVFLGSRSFGKGKPLCKECEKFITVLKKVLQNPEFVNKLIGELNTICNLPLLSSYKSECLSVVNYLVVGLHELQAYLDDPAVVCQTLHFCDTEMPGLNLATKKFLLAISAKVVQDVQNPSGMGSNKIDTCDLCVSAINQLKKILETPEYMNKLESEVEKLCKYTGKYQTDCQQSVQLIFPKIVQHLLNFLCQSMDVCTGFKLCKSQNGNAAASITNSPQLGPQLTRILRNLATFQPNGMDVKCTTCKTTVKLIFDYLKQDKIETEIANDLTNTACKLFPAELQDGCYDFMGLYAKASVVFTLDEWSPQDICVAVHACKNNTMSRLQFLQNGGQNGQALCKACQFLTQELAAELEKPEVQQEIITYLSQLCLLIPGHWGYKCGDLVIQYVPIAIAYIVDFLHRSDACNVLHMC